MTSSATADFWAQYRELPRDVRELARKAFRQWMENPQHPSLHWKRISGSVWSARVSYHYRAVARVNGEDVLWFWIGSHAGYDRLLRGA
jgi:hypothetical protein